MLWDRFFSTTKQKVDITYPIAVALVSLGEMADNLPLLQAEQS